MHNAAWWLTIAAYVVLLAGFAFAGVALPHINAREERHAISFNSLTRYVVAAEQWAANWLGIPTTLLLGGAMGYHLFVSFTLQTYGAIGVLTFVVFIPLRRLLGMWVTRKVYAQQEPLRYSFARNVWDYVSEVWRPTRAYKPAFPRWQQYLLTPLWYICLWPAAVAVGTWQHIRGCQDAGLYVWPHWRHYVSATQS